MNDNEKTLNSFIASNYDKLKEYIRTANNGFINEDIFHETLIRCMSKFNETPNLNNEYLVWNFIPYFIKAYKTNAIREFQYYSNRNKVDCSFDEYEFSLNPYFGDSCSIETIIDYNMLFEKVKYEFGIETFEKFSDWMNGYTIEDINKIHSCNNSRYTIDKVRKFLRSHI